MTDYIALNTAYDEQTVRIIERTLGPSSTGVDVGCHSGAILQEFIRVAPQGRHYGFEPIPAYFDYLTATFPSAQLFQLALSDESGETTFQYVTSNPGYSGLRQRRYDRPNETIETISVKVDRLDAVIPADVPVALIKIDVEGAEYNVLKGAEATIRRHRPAIVFEHGLGGADRYGATPEMVHELLGSCGLRVSLMADWLEDRAPLTRQAFADQYYGGLNFYFMGHPER